jgi:hypothetical protein
MSGAGYNVWGLACRGAEDVDIITRTSHYERCTMSGTGYNVWGLACRGAEDVDIITRTSHYERCTMRVCILRMAIFR